MQTKTCPVKIKAAGSHEGTDEGVFEAIVATWDLDSGGDKIVKGAFADTLAEWKSSGNPIPVIWSHMSHDPHMHVGTIEDAEEREDGLWVKGRLDLENPTAAQVYRLLKGRRVTQFSFSYDILDGGPVEQTTDGKDSSYFELRKLKMYEAGPTLIGMNQSTDLIGVKAVPDPSSTTVTVNVAQPGFTQTAVTEDKAEHSADGGETSDLKAADPLEKAGRTLSAKNEDRIRQIAEIAQDLLASTVESGGSDDEKAKPTPSAAPSGDEPARSGTASLRQRLDIELFGLEVDSLTS